MVRLVQASSVGVVKDFGLKYATGEYGSRRDLDWWMFMELVEKSSCSRIKDIY